MLKRLLAHPLTRGLDLDDPRTTELRRRIVRQKPFLRRLYREWYSLLAAAIPQGPGAVLELGSGGGFLDEVLPEAVTSEVFWCPGVQAVMDGRQLPLVSGSLRAILMLDVFHHIPDAGALLREAARCLRPGGAVAMIEPWVTPWSRLVFGKLHHEPFEPDASEWSLPASGPLSGANGALPWIVFRRDARRFAREHPELSLESIVPGFPVSYLFSGGVSLRSLAPGGCYGLVRQGERLLAGGRDLLACFAFIQLRRS